ncbi:hypothetical protein [Chitinophaga solisilvae]|uniref:hypothetical protein n=1 Tax=Chitinophaga solisilvae TaxID=1233460 RepID=UPI001369B7FF|nr:hypothetical protein [Chitinophaga solisilvae]
MKFDPQHRLCIEGHEFIRTPQHPGGLVPKGTYDSLKNRNRIEVLERGGNGRTVLIVYESLPPAYKEMITAHFGNPYEYASRQPLLELVVKDTRAEKFFLEYRYGTDKCLSPAQVEKYVTAASWLNMLIRMQDDKRFVRQQLGITMEHFWKLIPELTAARSVALPQSYKRLSERIKSYRQEGYAALIDWRFGNRNSAKIKDELSESMLLELIAHPNQHDDTIIAAAYNRWAAAHGYAAITAATVGLHRRSNNYQLQLFREGNAAWYNRYGRHIKRFRPSAPLLLVGSDDNDIDLYFRNETTGKGNQLSVQYYHRFRAVVISDAFNDYPLGFFYADNLSVHVVKMAYLDAMYHIRELTGGWYLPHQLQTDRWNQKALLPFYQRIDPGYFAAAAKAPRSKYIERTFGTRWHQHLRRFPNYAGNNITSGFRLNPEHVERSKRLYPHKDDSCQILESFIDGLRRDPQPRTGMTRQEVWKAAFNASELAREKEISEEQFLFLFGILHDYSNTITNGGIRLTIDGNVHEYEIPEQYLRFAGKKIQAYYDPYNFSRILVTDGQQLRFIAHSYEKLPAARADYQADDQEKLFRQLHRKKAYIDTILRNKKNRESILEQHQLDAAGLLQARVMVKEIRQAAEASWASSGNPATPFDPLDLM